MDHNILTKRQLALLEAIQKIPALSGNFYLTGGTALAAFYLHHRYSEDLDFFSEHEIDLLPLNTFFTLYKKESGITLIDFQQSFNRNLFFLHFPDKEILKTEFTYFPFPRIIPEKQKDGLNIDSALDIAVNKLFTIYQRSAARDYIDLYCIHQKFGFTMGELIEKAKIKFDWHIDPLQLGTQFIKAQTAEDFPRMIQELSPEEWRGFFKDEALKLKKDILAE